MVTYGLNHRSPELKIKKRGKAHDAFALIRAMIARDAFATFFKIFLLHVFGFFIKLTSQY